MSANDKAAATYHPHPSYLSMEAAWDPERREQARLALAQAFDQFNAQRALARTWATGDLARSIDKYTRPINRRTT